MTDRDRGAEAAAWERLCADLQRVVDHLVDAAGVAVSALAGDALERHGAHLARAVEALKRIRSDYDRELGKDGEAVDYDDFRRRVEGDRQRIFEAFQEEFNRQMRRAGKADTLDSVLGGGPPPPEPELPSMPPWDEEKGAQLAELFLDVYRETTDEDPRDVVLRAMAVYRSFVRHARAGGQVKFVKDGEKDRTLKVRLR